MGQQLEAPHLGRMPLHAGIVMLAAFAVRFFPFV